MRFLQGPIPSGPLALLVLLAALPAHAQNLQRATVVSTCGSSALPSGPLTNLTMNPQGQLCIGGSVAPPYSGPGDAIAGAKAWFGLRAYSSSQLAGTTKSVNLRRASDNTSCDFDIAATGALGNSDAGCSLGGGLTLAAFATQDATASCTVATTTATCTGGTSVPHAGSTLSGAGLTQPCYASAAGSGTAASFTVAVAGGIGAAAPCGAVGAATTLTFTYGLYTTKWYDQTGLNNCTTACDLVQAVAAKQPQLQPSCVNSLPCLGFTIAGTTAINSTNTQAIVTTLASVSAVAIRTGAFTTGQRMLTAATAASAGTGFNAVANQAFMQQGTQVNISGVADQAWHAFNFSFAASASSFSNIDGVQNTPTTAGAGSWSGSILGIPGTAGFMTGNMTETGIWAFSFTNVQANSMCHNQFAYWGTSVSC